MAKPPLPPDHLLPPDLLELRGLHAAIPRVDIKFTLVQGQRFLRALRATDGRYPVARIAEVLGVTTTTIYAMRKTPLDRYPRRWPSDRQVAPLVRTWARAKGRGRNSREYLAAHTALKGLLESGFVLLVIARKMKVPVADLQKFVKPPVVPRDQRTAWQGSSPGRVV